MTLFQRIHVEQRGPRLKITLAYAKRRNAIGPQMTNELLYALEEARRDDTVRVVVITGEGSVFSAGGDFAQMPLGGESLRPPPVGVEALPPQGDYADLLMTLLRYDKPVIARVNGHALGTGLGLVAACTFSVALESAQLGTPEINVGLFPVMVMSLLARVVPRRRLLDMMLLGHKMDAREAARLGLVGQVAEPGELDETVREIEEQLLQKSAFAVRLGLRAFAAQQDIALAEALPKMREYFAQCLASEDAREGLMAFMEKRAPLWVGR
ncbi:MAG TPA: enoyl-CoA hydratase-related protein [Polyangiaceae bacterium]|nr:enoyl-CoA hydratase-related protein [Polyangiaceae bacterium]